MTMLRRLGCVKIWFAVAVFVIGTAVSNGVSGQQVRKSLPARQAGNDDPNSPSYRLPGNEPQSGADRDKLLADIKENLDTAVIKPPHSKKADDDFFVVGTVDLQNHHAVVEFLIKQGVQQTADFIADFVLGKERGSVREWRVLGRAKNMKVAENLRTKAKSESVESRLAAFKSSTSGKLSPDDYFVVGTADLDPRTSHADIRFEILAGIKETADFLIDFIFNSPKNHKGEWHVFFRGRTEAQAIVYREQLRGWYDNMESQRAQIAAIYNAKTTARC
jgi:hypothetical protein